MSRHFTSLAIFFVVTAMLSTMLEARPFASDRVLVKYRSSAEGRKRPGALGHFGRSGVTLHRVPAGKNVEKALTELRRDPAVLYAEPDYILEPLLVPDDQYYQNLWGLQKIEMPEAWNLSTGSEEIVVAVIDTGIDYTHPDLEANIWVNTGEIPGNGIDDDGNGYVDDVHGYDFANRISDPMDTHSHGTHCAGIIGAVMNNEIGVVGVSPRVRLMACKFLNPQGYTSDAIRAIEYAVANGARVLSNSWGGGGFSLALKDAIDMAGAHGVVFVAAAGNDSANTDNRPSYPSCYTSSNIISVGASDSEDVMAYFSNYGPVSVDVFAPGYSILSTVPGGYKYYNGTSMACPHVSGLSVLLLTGSPDILPSNIRDILISTADRVDSLKNRCVSGGRINAKNALYEAFPMPRPTVRRFIISGGDGDGFAESGETVSLVIELENTGLEMTGISARLIADHSPVEVLEALSSYPDALTGAVITNRTPFTIRVGTQDNIFRRGSLGLELASNDGLYKRTLSVPFSTGRDCEILIVDDDNGSLKHEALMESLRRLGYSPAIWRTGSEGTPPLREMRPSLVIWHCGGIEGQVLSQDEIAEIRAYLQLGGALILSGSGWATQLSGDSFCSDVLGVTVTGETLPTFQQGRSWLSGVDFSINAYVDPGRDRIAPRPGALLLASESPSSGTGGIVYRPGAGTTGPAISISFDLSYLGEADMGALLDRCVRKTLRPRIITAAPQNGSVSLSWRRPFFAESVEMSATAAGEQSVTAMFGGISGTLGGTRNGLVWSVAPRAGYSDGFFSEYGISVECTPTAGGGAALASVGAIVTEPEARGVKVSWTASPDGRCAGYVLEARRTSGLVASIRTDGLSALVGREYLEAVDGGMLWVYPVDSLGAPGSSREALWEYDDVYPPEDAVNVVVKKSPGHALKLAWTHGGSVDIDGYLVDIAGERGDYGEALRIGAVNEVGVSSVSKGVVQHIRIRAVDSAGNVSSGTVVRYGSRGYNGELSGCGCSNYLGDRPEEASTGILIFNHLLNVFILGMGVLLRKAAGIIRRFLR